MFLFVACIAVDCSREECAVVQYSHRLARSSDDGNRETYRMNFPLLANPDGSVPVWAVVARLVESSRQLLRDVSLCTCAGLAAVEKEFLSRAGPSFTTWLYASAVTKYLLLRYAMWCKTISASTCSVIEMSLD